MTKNDNAHKYPYIKPTDGKPTDGFQVINPFKKMYRFWFDMPVTTDKEKFAWLGLKCGCPREVICAVLRISPKTVLRIKNSFDSSPTEPPKEPSDMD